MKNKIYNVVILDKSGSMNSIRRVAIDSVNETFGCIRSLRKKNPDQLQLVTLVAFCACEQKVIYENTPIEEVRDITRRDYEPCCGTPLYDAIGNVCTRLHQAVKDCENASVMVTVITDGYENASREFSAKAIKALIEAYKEEGWMFAYIGADHDVESVAFSLSIDNALLFEKTEEGTRQMADRLHESMKAYDDKVMALMEEERDGQISKGELLERKRSLSKKFFRF